MNTEHNSCTPCATVGSYVPWGFLVGGAIVSAMPDLLPGWQEEAAYLMGLALLILAFSYVLKRLTRHLPH